MNTFQMQYATKLCNRKTDTVVAVLLCLLAICNAAPVLEDDKSANKTQQEVTVFPWSNHYGVSATMTLDESTKCADIPKLWQKKVSSVNTHGNCVMLCSKNNCKGKCIKLEPGSPSHNRLRDLNFDKKPISVGVCDAKANSKGSKKKVNKNENEVIGKRPPTTSI